ncbi:MAG: RidA family protein [Elusimicrobia bacterium]|nr:RidA family protein [Elusimicrobiota bacterium]
MDSLANIQKLSGPGIYSTTISRHNLKEIYISVYPNAGEQFPAMIDRLAHSLKTQNAEIVKFDVFGPLSESGAFIKYLENAFGRINWPVTWVEGNRYPGSGIAGIQVHAVSGVKVETIFLDAKPAARVFEDNLAKYCFIGNVNPDVSSVPRSEQARQTLEKLEKTLGLAGMKVSNIVRTWFYNADIVQWYAEFNAARTGFFKQKAIFGGLLPASTGIGGNNPAHSALIAGAVSIQTKQKNVIIREVLSPLQDPASAYGSLFSRAVEIVMPDHRCVLVSGTASIDISGKTAHIDDIDAQIAFTMKVVGAILASRKMGFSDITRSIVYLKRAKDIAAFNNYCQDHEKTGFPMIVLCADICRDDLLFEIEVDAISRSI